MSDEVRSREMKNECCFMDADNQCMDAASFVIQEATRDDPDNYTYACEKHVGAMLGTTEGFKECREWIVSVLD